MIRPSVVLRVLCTSDDRKIDPACRHLPVRNEEMKMVSESEILKDKDYDLISVIYHASQGCETARQYAADAQRENDQEAAAFFDKALEMNVQLVAARPWPRCRCTRRR